MKILNDEEIERYFGAEDVWTPRRLEVPSLRYAGGIKSINDRIKSCDANQCLSHNILDKSKCSIHLTKKGLIITITIGSSKLKTGILVEDINYWIIERLDEIIANKCRSIVGLALMKGRLHLPHIDLVGSAGGTITDLGKKGINYGVIACSYKERMEGENEAIIFFSCENKDIRTVGEFFKYNLGDKFKKPPVL